MSYSVFKTILASSLFISLAAHSADLSQTKLQAQKISDELNHAYQVQTNIENFRVNEIVHQYIVGYGLTFGISTNVDELVNVDNSIAATLIQDEQAQVSQREQDTESHKAKQELNTLRLQARNIAHQEFSLHKKINSMQSQSLKSGDEAQKQAIDDKIRVSQDKLKDITYEKAKVSNQIARLSTENHEQEDKPEQSSRGHLYQTLLNQSLQLLCQKPQLTAKLSKSDKLTLIFKALGQVDAINFQDEVISFEIDAVAQCSNGEISPLQLREQAHSYQY